MIRCNALAQRNWLYVTRGDSFQDVKTTLRYSLKMSTPTEINQLRMPEIRTYRVREMVASFGRVADYKTTEACDAQTLAQTVVESLFFWFSPYLATVTVSSGDRVTSPSSASKAGRPSSDDVFGEKLKTAAFSCR